MNKLSFTIEIDAPVDSVYKTMLDDGTYREWTKEFNLASHYQGSWEKGAKILFIGMDGDGNRGGMVSRIKENIANEFVSIEHLGILKDTGEVTEGPEVEGWAGALENYTFKPSNGGTLLTVDMDANEEFENYFADTWPKALARLKSICESRNHPA